MRYFVVFILTACCSLVNAQTENHFQSEANLEPQIVFLSGHYPLNVYFAQETRKSFENYTSRHGYGFYYEESEPSDTALHSLHFRRCEIIQKAFEKYPSAQWFIWVDSDVYVNRPELRVESQIDLTDTNILYHLFHERPFSFLVNTGVKIVNRDALELEQEMWDLRNTAPWYEFPFEQKTLAEYILPKIPGRYIIHDPYVLNCINFLYPDKVTNALFIHMCANSSSSRNMIMARQAKKVERENQKKAKKERTALR